MPTWNQWLRRFARSIRTPPSRFRQRPTLEVLEDRSTPAVFVGTNQFGMDVGVITTVQGGVHKVQGLQIGIRNLTGNTFEDVFLEPTTSVGVPFQFLSDPAFRIDDAGGFGWGDNTAIPTGIFQSGNNFFIKFNSLIAPNFDTMSFSYTIERREGASESASASFSETVTLNLLTRTTDLLGQFLNDPSSEVGRGVVEATPTEAQTKTTDPAGLPDVPQRFEIFTGNNGFPAPGGGLIEIDTTYRLAIESGSGWTVQAIRGFGSLDITQALLDGGVDFIGRTEIFLTPGAGATPTFSVIVTQHPGFSLDENDTFAAGMPADVAAAQHDQTTDSFRFVGTVQDPNTLIVNTRADLADPNLNDGVDSDPNTPGEQLSLRDAITLSNQTPGRQTIRFAIPDGSTIVVDSPLPVITDGVDIDGTTQAGGQVELTGQNDDLNEHGLQVVNANGVVIQGFAVNNFGGAGVVLQGGGGHRLEGNRLGTTADGNAAKPNGLDAVQIINSNGNTVAGNLLSGNRRHGVFISEIGSFDNVVVGNLIGTIQGGTAAIGNEVSGVTIENAGGNRIGGPEVTDRNLISGNSGDGVHVTGNTGLVGNRILNNVIGLKLDTNSKLGNALNGVHLSNGASLTVIGGDQPEEGNVIAGNKVNGVLIEGTDTTLNELVNNVIGSNTESASGLGNEEHGVAIVNAPGNSVGTTVAGNLIIGNGTTAFEGVPVPEGSSGGGVLIRGLSASGNSVLRNRFVDPDAENNFVPRNATFGVRIEDAPDNVIGLSGQGNLIGGTGFLSVRTAFTPYVIFGNGVVLSGSGTRGNRVQANQIGLYDFTLTNGGSGVLVEDGASNNVIGGTATGEGNVVVANGQYGIHLRDAATAGNVIQGNRIGESGEEAVPESRQGGNNLGGILVEGAADTVIGGLTPLAGTGAGNHIAGNHPFSTGFEDPLGIGDAVGLFGANGIEVRGVMDDGTVTGAPGTVIQGNRIGLGLDGTTRISNVGSGIEIAAARNTTIGGTDPQAGNLIAEEFGHGIFVNNTPDRRVERVGAFRFADPRRIEISSAIVPDNVQILGNRLGIDVNGEVIETGDDPEAGRRAGILVEAGTGVVVGGSAPGTGNTVAGYFSAGVVVFNTAGVPILRNSVFENEGPGIELAGTGNANEPAPTLTNVVTFGTSRILTGTHPGDRNASYRLEFFLNDEADSSGFGEGKTFLSAIVVLAGRSTDDFATVFAPGAVPDGAFLTATATRLNADGSPLQTSAFSNALATTAADSDGDGTGDVIENLGDGDLNDDTIPDRDQPSVASIPKISPAGTPTLEEVVGLIESNNRPFRNVQSVPTTTSPTANDVPGTVALPLGVQLALGAKFEVDLDAPGNVVDVVFRLPLSFGTPNRIFKVLANGSLLDITNNPNVTIGEGTVTLRVLDGGPFDNDLLVDGKVSDPILFAQGNQADVTVAVNAPAAVIVGQDAIVNVVVSNLGPDLADSVVVTLTLPVGTQFISTTADNATFDPATRTIRFPLQAVAAGGTAVLSATVRPTVTGTSFFNAAVELTGLAIDPDPADNRATAIVSVTLTPSVVPPAPLVNNVTAALVNGRLVLTGDDLANNVVIKLGKNVVFVRGLDGTTINGQGLVVFRGVKRGLVARLLGGNDRVRVTGSGLAGPVVLDGGAGNDTFSLAPRQTTVVIRDSQGRDRVGFVGAVAGVELDLNLNRGEVQRVGGGGNRLVLEGVVEDATGSPFEDTLTGLPGVSRLDDGDPAKPGSPKQAPGPAV